MKVAVPCESEAGSTAYRVGLELGHVGDHLRAPLPTGSPPTTRPRRPDRSLMTAPMYSSDTSTLIRSTGSSRGDVGLRRCLLEGEPAGLLEGHVGRVDRVRLAVDEGDADVDEG